MGQIDMYQVIQDRGIINYQYITHHRWRAIIYCISLPEKLPDPRRQENFCRFAINSSSATETNPYGMRPDKTKRQAEVEFGRNSLLFITIIKMVVPFPFSIDRIDCSILMPNYYNL